MGLSKPSVTETIVYTWLLSQLHILYIPELHPILFWGGSLGSGHPQNTADTRPADMGITPSCQLHPFPKCYSFSRDGWTGKMNINFCWFHCLSHSTDFRRRHANRQLRGSDIPARHSSCLALDNIKQNKPWHKLKLNPSFWSLHLDHTLCHKKTDVQVSRAVSNY